MCYVTFSVGETADVCLSISPWKALHQNRVREERPSSINKILDAISTM